ncbi:CBS domain-containing protein [Pedobacter nyackensis]|uniref:CBS domain-containing protein n=1 Tax=Pedobacter nyackensis TaxID=475255 RepID=A0A1W2F8A9_9SPHI|nr:hypothetical protein [Pedobacter nyackensis]SMD17838.1 hypothetical protein SAMN04488101_12434 [Pedobacter nyackensis]
MIPEELKQHILLKIGLTKVTSRDCKKIALAINQSLNRNTSVTTIKRVFGFAKSNHQLSKYTLATLHDFVVELAPVLPSCISGEQVVSSFLIKHEAHLFELNDQVGLHPERLVIDALEILFNQDHEFLPLVIEGKCVGIIYLRDLTYFLTRDEKKFGALFHKFNFTLECAIDMLKDIK